MSAKHTPGPWVAKRDEVWAGRRRICPTVTAGESLPLGADYERSCHNARLIAAAPELLEALRRLTAKVGEHTIAGDPWGVELLDADAAIAKATGEQS